jgi:hypothetical protein
MKMLNNNFTIIPQNNNGSLTIGDNIAKFDFATSNIYLGGDNELNSPIYVYNNKVTIDDDKLGIKFNGQTYLQVNKKTNDLLTKIKEILIKMNTSIQTLYRNSVKMIVYYVLNNITIGSDTNNDLKITIIPLYDFPATPTSGWIFRLDVYIHDIKNKSDFTYTSYPSIYSQNENINFTYNDEIISDIWVYPEYDISSKIPLHQPKRKMRQTYLFLYILKLCFR